MDEVSDCKIQFHHQEWEVPHILRECKNDGIIQQKGRKWLQPPSSLTLFLLALSGSSHSYILLKFVTPFSLSGRTVLHGQCWVEFHVLCKPRSAHWAFSHYRFCDFVVFLSCAFHFCFVLQISDLLCFKSRLPQFCFFSQIHHGFMSRKFLKCLWRRA